MSPSLAEMPILLVEDDPADVELTLGSLAEIGISNPIDVVRDGVEALDYVFRRGRYANRDIEEDPCLILLDLRLPLLNGLEVLRRIKGAEGTRSIRVIVLSGSISERGVLGSFELGVAGYILKPIDVARLADALKVAGLRHLLPEWPAERTLRDARWSARPG